MPSKPGKYGIKNFWLCDASIPYAFNEKIYVGKQPGTATEKNLGQNLVLYLTEPIQNTGKNVNIDNYLTGIQLANMMLHRRLTIVGTVRKCKREVPDCMKAAESHEQKLSTFGFHERLTLTSNVPKRNKAVILASSMDNDVSIIEDDAQKRPKIIHFYNKKTGVDLVDQMVQTYTCKRATPRWPFALFCNMLDIAALNAYTIFQKLHPK